MVVFALFPSAAAAVGTNVRRALVSYRAMQREYYVRSAYLYGPEPGDAGPYAYLWPFSQAVSATNSVAAMPRIGLHFRSAILDRLRGLPAYWDRALTPPGYDSDVVRFGTGTVYYDDNEWIALDLLAANSLLGGHHPELVRRAQALFKLVLAGWDRNPSDPCPGGVFWTQRPGETSRNTTTTAPAAQLALQLYRLTGKFRYRVWAIRMYSWVRQCLRDPSGLYDDKINSAGTRDPTFWIYNQGSMLGAESLLYEVTGNRKYLRRAELGARAAMSFFRGPVLDAQPPFFVAIFARDLLELDKVHHRRPYRAYLAGYASRAWHQDRDPETGTFDFHQQPKVHLLEQAAMVQVYSLLASESPSRRTRTTPPSTRAGKP